MLFIGGILHFSYRNILLENKSAVSTRLFVVVLVLSVVPAPFPPVLVRSTGGSMLGICSTLQY